MAFVLPWNSPSGFERVQVCSIADELELDTGRQGRIDLLFIQVDASAGAMALVSRGEEVCFLICMGEHLRLDHPFLRRRVSSCWSDDAIVHPWHLEYDFAFRVNFIC